LYELLMLGSKLRCCGSQPAAMMRRIGKGYYEEATVVGQGVRYFTGEHGAGTRDDTPVRTQASYSCCSRAKRGGRVLHFVPAAYARAFGMYGVSVRSALRVLGGCSAAFCLGYAAPAILATKVHAACMHRRRHSNKIRHSVKKLHSSQQHRSVHRTRAPRTSPVFFLLGIVQMQATCLHS
jgi:hypothetical protein